MLWDQESTAILLKCFMDGLEEARGDPDKTGTLGYYKQTTPVKIETV